MDFSVNNGGLKLEKFEGKRLNCTIQYYYHTLQTHIGSKS